jgi:hypothetical protein
MLQLENSSFETRKLPECHRLLGFSPIQQRSALLIFLHAGHGVGRRPLDDHRFLKKQPLSIQGRKNNDPVCLVIHARSRQVAWLAWHRSFCLGILDARAFFVEMDMSYPQCRSTS